MEDAIFHGGKGVRELAANPLLLTLLALIKRRGVVLPDQRVELYEEYVKALVENWAQHRNPDRIITRTTRYAETERVLAGLALWMRETNPEVGTVDERAMQDWLTRKYNAPGTRIEEARAAAEKFVSDLRNDCGLIVERGQGVYGFIHQTLEEYLAAKGLCYLSDTETEPILEEMRQHKMLGSDIWRETALLAVGHLSVVQRAPGRAAQLVEKYLAEELSGDARGLNIVRAGQALADLGRAGVSGDVWANTVQSLVGLLEEKDPKRLVPILTRTDAGDVLGLLGDSRITDDAWVEVPAGEFLMGTTPQEVKKLAKQYGNQWGEEYKREVPQREVSVGSFRIGKYPVTNQEFKRFMDLGGYEKRGYWSDDGWKWRQRTPEEEKELPEWQKRGEKTQPAYWDDPRCGIRKPNRPVVGITWYEAQAYCSWLTEKLRQEGKIAKGEVVRLTTEAQWEKAARGVDGRWWPWGNTWDNGKANAGYRLDEATPVGVYPHGTSPYDVYDMVGNVWEWASSLYMDYPYNPDDGREDQNAAGVRVLRGGSWFYDAVLARCASRLAGIPDSRYVILGFRCVVVPQGSPKE